MNIKHCPRYLFIAQCSIIKPSCLIYHLIYRQTKELSICKRPLCGIGVYIIVKASNITEDN